MRLYVRNCFGQVTHITQYASKITLDLTETLYQENGITLQQIETIGVIPIDEGDNDRTITCTYDESGKKTLSGLPAELLAWIELQRSDNKDVPMLKWSEQVGPTTSLQYNTFGDCTAEFKLIHGDDTSSKQADYEWKMLFHWKDERGKSILTAESISTNSFKVTAYVNNHLGHKAQSREYTYAFTAADLFSTQQPDRVTLGDTQKSYKDLTGLLADKQDNATDIVYDYQYMPKGFMRVVYCAMKKCNQSCVSRTLINQAKQ